MAPGIKPSLVPVLTGITVRSGAPTKPAESSRIASATISIVSAWVMIS